MSTRRALAPGKVNLCLFVGPLRPDGYHGLVSLVLPVSLCDEVGLAPSADGADGAGDEVVCPGVEGPNLVAAAIAAFRAGTGWDGPAQRVEVRKRLPVAAGMAGGSADAAATLRLLAAEAGGVDPATLAQIGARVGADVPALLAGGPCLVTGFGDRVRPVPASLASPWLLAVLASDRRLATGEVFAEADRLGLARDARALADLGARVESAASSGDGLATELLVNDLEPAARSLCPSIDGELARLRDAGAEHAMVSGSGPTVVGLFARGERAGEDRAQSLARGLEDALGPAVTVVEPLAGHPVAAPLAAPDHTTAA